MQGCLVMSNYCPEWILGVAVGVIVGDALTGSTSILANSQKYSDGLSKHYDEVSKDFLNDTANDIIAELTDIGIDEFTPRFVKSFVFNRIKFKESGSTRRFNVFFNQFKGEKSAIASKKSLVPLKLSCLGVAPKKFLLHQRIGIYIKKNKLTGFWL